MIRMGTGLGMRQEGGNFNLSWGVVSGKAHSCTDWEGGNLRSGSLVLEVSESHLVPGKLCCANRAGGEGCLGGQCWLSWDLWDDNNIPLTVPASRSGICPINNVLC